MPKSKTVLQGQELSYGVIDNVTLNQAFQLAHSIYRYRSSDRKIALEILCEALKGVDVRLVAQHEADRHTPPKPTKVRWKKTQWLQILIYCKSEIHEKEQEAHDRGGLTEEDMIIRYVKHLILTTCRRNSFHISLGLSRLLYDYRAAESMAIYDLVFQDPDSSTRKADAYYRARKNTLIEELARRFERFLRIGEGVRGEKRFERRDDSGQFSDLVKYYLTLFTPWETRCELPEQLTTWTPVYALQASQCSQIHSLIHPRCLARIIEALKLDPPEGRLALPGFFLREGQSDDPVSPGSSGEPSNLTPEEALGIRGRIAEEEERRRKFTPRSLLVVADGVELVSLDLAESSQLSFEGIAEEITLIELIGTDGVNQVLLATHVVTSEVEDQADEYSIMLEGGQKISLTISHGVEEATSSFKIKYQETEAMRAAAWRLRQLNHRLFNAGLLKSGARFPALSPKLIVLLLLALIVGAALVYLGLRSEPGQQIARQQPTPQINSGNLPAVETPSISQPSPGVVRTPTPVTGKPETRFKRNGGTRDQTERPITALSSVKRIYIEALGDDAFAQTVREQLMEKLRAVGLAADTPDQADTALTGSARLVHPSTNESTNQRVELGTVTLQLINISGDILLRTRNYRGTADQVVEQITNDLGRALPRE